MNYLSVDIGGTFTKFGLIDHSGNFLNQWKKKTPNSLDGFQNLLLFEVKKYESSIKGIGVSCPGRVDAKMGYIHTGGALKFLYDFQIKEWLSQYTSLPLSLINDGKAAALSEWWIGNLKGIENGVAIVLGTGVGGGLILDNHLYNGSHFQAGELSFILQNHSENVPTQLLGYSCSAVRFIQEATALIGVAPEDYHSVFESIESKGSQPLRRLFEQYCSNIAQLISNLQAILDLEKVVIGGGVSAQNSLIRMINQQYEKLRQQEPLLGRTMAALQIDACKFRNSANLLGALHQLLLDLDE